jgi:hypothetical protein
MDTPIIKERTGKLGIQRDNNYGTGLPKILRLVEEARRDFPTLPNEAFEVVFYGGDNFKRTMGVEFQTDQPFPESYTLIHQTHSTL